MFHSLTTADENGIADEYECTEFGQNAPEDVERELQGRVKDALKECLPKKYEEELQRIMHGHKQGFQIRLGEKGPAKVALMKIKLDPSKKPVRVKVRRYTLKQQKFLDTYFNQLVSKWHIFR